MFGYILRSRAIFASPSNDKNPHALQNCLRGPLLNREVQNNMVPNCLRNLFNFQS